MRVCIVLIVGVMQMLDGVWEVVMGCGADWRMGLTGGVAFHARNGRTRSIVSDEQTAE
ncbi:MAG: hypothetical protein ACO363_07930 [Balneolaceae bacterium]